MSLNFSAEQYEDAFVPHRLQNYQIPGKYPPKNPVKRNGFTQAVATRKGYILPSVQRSNNSPWGSFVGTWDAPLHIPGPRQQVPTARSADAARKLVAQKDEAYFVLSGRQKSLKDHHPQAGVELPECYPSVDKKKYLKAAQCMRPVQADITAAHREEEYSNKYDAHPERQQPLFDMDANPPQTEAQMMMADLQPADDRLAE